MTIIKCGENGNINDIVPKNFIKENEIPNKIENLEIKDEANLLNNIFTKNNSASNSSSSISITEDEINSIIGKTRFYNLKLKNDPINNNYDIALENENPIANMEIDYNSVYNIKESLPKNTKYVRITYDSSVNPLKKEYFNENNEIIYIIILAYNSNEELISESEYNSSLNLVMNKKYYPENGKIKVEKLYDDNGMLLYTKLFSYNSLNLLIQETLLDSNNIIAEYNKFTYNKGKLVRECLYSADGILQTEIYYNEKKNPVLIDYIEKGNKVNYREKTEYYDDQETIRVKTDIDKDGNVLSETYFDKDGYQTKLISYFDGVKETRLFRYSEFSNTKILDLIEIYTGDPQKLIEYTNYYYDKETGEVNNWITYDSKGNVIDSMDMSY